MLGQWCEAIYIHIHYIFSSSINFISWKMWKIRNFINRRFHPLVLQATSYNFIFCTNKIPLHLQDVTINRLPALTKVGMHISSLFLCIFPRYFLSSLANIQWLGPWGVDVHSLITNKKVPVTCYATLFCHLSVNMTSDPKLMVIPGKKYVSKSEQISKVT